MTTTAPRLDQGELVEPSTHYPDPTDSIVAAGLRRWARGCWPDEAAVELLIGTAEGRLIHSQHPWIVLGRHNLCWIDTDHITDQTLAGLEPGQQTILRLAGSLVGGAPVDLAETLPALAPEHLPHLIAAIVVASTPFTVCAPLDPSGDAA